jgi:glycosyltransferase involved in cell wall biosynthesis
MASVGNLELQTRAQPLHAPPSSGPLPRVLYAVQLNPGHKFGSIEEQIVTLAERFHSDGSLFLPLFVSTAPEENLVFYRERGIPAECFDLSRFRLSTLKRLIDFVRAHQIDVVHWNFTSPLGNPYLWWLTVLRPRLRHCFTDHVSRAVPTTATPHGPKRWLKKVLLRRYRRVFCVSGFVHASLAAQRVLPENRLTTCLHFINTDRFRPDMAVRDRLRRELRVQGRFVVLVVGHLIRAKGIDVLIRAMALVPADAVLWIIGDGADRPELEALVASASLSERARFLGHQHDVVPFMQAADCFACPSTWAEAAGLVNIEAAACALPVIASRVGGIPEYLDDGRTGFLFEPGNATELADRLNQLVRDRALCRTLGQAARAMAVERFSTDARLADVLELYHTV